jgi:protein-L-isoaspartate(D-aspartate) O-methyltransferase
MNSNLVSGIGMTSQRTRERLIARLQDSGIKSFAVLDAMRATPRHIFVDEALATRAYEDTALPIGFQQTLSQPYIVARMTELLLKSDGLATGEKLNRVLEIGTGSGYQTAILSQLVNYVYTTERISQLQTRAKERLNTLNLKNIRFQHSDGNYGWAQEGPFDAIISTAAPEVVPKALVNQLKIGGRLVIPVGGKEQFLQVITRIDEQAYETDVIEQVMFVPFQKGLA